MLERQPRQNPRVCLRCYGLRLAFLLQMAAEKDEGEGKQAKDKRVFFGFGDDLAVDNNPHRAKSGGTTPTIEGSRKEVADGFVDQACSHPRRSLPVAIKQVGRLGSQGAKWICLRDLTEPKLISAEFAGLRFLWF